MIALYSKYMFPSSLRSRLGAATREFSCPKPDPKKEQKKTEKKTEDKKAVVSDADKGIPSSLFGADFDFSYLQVRHR